MGNQPMEGIPPLLMKNWQPVPNQPNTFRNRLTHEYAHKHIVKVQQPIEIQSFKYRMHQNNEYLCRVLYYHEYTDAIYHVYTDEMHVQPDKRQSSKWAQEKINIMQTFKSLSELFGYTRVCRQMIGSDTNGHIKIWIHPDPISPKVWSPCPSETQMVADIQAILQSIQEVLCSKSLNKSYDLRNKTYSSFDQYIRQQNKKIAGQNHKRGQNVTQTHINNSTTNVNININIQLDGKGRPIVKQTPKVNPDSLQQNFNPVLCQTKRKEEQQVIDYSALDNSHSHSYKKMVYKGNRPSTQYPFFKHQKIMSHYRTQNNTKRRDSDFFKYAHLNPKSPNMTQGKNSSAYPSVGKKYEQSPSSNKNIQKNILGKLLNPHNIKYASKKITNNHINYVKKPSRQDSAHQQNERSISNLYGLNRTAPKGKNLTIPNFLAQRAAEGHQMKFRTCSSLEKYPQPSDRTDKNEPEQLNINLSPIENKIRRQNFSDNKEDDMGSAISMMKDQLNNILDTPVEREVIVSESFENFKATKALYKPCPSRQQDAEMEQIKQKVEKKKATFAHLKLEAMKILQDDF